MEVRNELLFNYNSALPILQVERYDELKKLVHKQGAVFSQQAEKLQWELKANSEKIAFDQRRKKEMEVQFCIVVLYTTKYRHKAKIC